MSRVECMTTQHYTTLLRQHTQMVEVRVYLASCQFYMGEYDEAIALCQQVLLSRAPATCRRPTVG